MGIQGSLVCFLANEEHFNSYLWPSFFKIFKYKFGYPRPRIASSTSMNLDVVVIDDDAVVLFLHKILIKRSSFPSNVKDFLDAGEALEYVTRRSEEQNILVFLDINMPGINGWDFLGRIGQLPGRDRVFVIMVTSSINWSDRKKAQKYSRVIDYREKPLSKQDCEEIYIKLLPKLKS